MKRSITLCFLFAITSMFVYAQKVTNVRSEQNRQDIVVWYDLSGKADISVSMYVDGKKKPITRLSGDVGKRINKGIDRKIVWNVLSEYPEGFEADNVQFTVKAYPIWRTFVLVEGALSPSPLQGSGGFMLGRAARWGYYLKFRSSFMFSRVNGEFGPSWIQMDGNYLNGRESDINKLITGNKKNTELICDVGALYNFSRNTDYPMYVYLGIGYGLRRQVWEFNDNIWLKYAPTSFEGASVDLGLMFSIKNFLIDIGVNTINFGYAEIQFGLGWLFNK